MSSGVTLSSATRSNLLALQNTADLVSTTQNRLSTGKKVNSAIDNASNFFTASGLNSRSSALSTLLDGISNGIQTIQAANQGITSIQKLTAQLKSTAQQALASSNSFTSKAASSTTIATATAANLLSSGVTTATAANTVGATSGSAAAGVLTGATYTADSDVSTAFGSADKTFSIDGVSITTNHATDITKAALLTDINTQLAAGGSGVVASFASNALTLTGTADGATFNLSGTNADLVKSGANTTAVNTTGTFIATGATLARSLGFSNGQTFTVNGATVTVAKSDTLDILAQKIGSATGGTVTASFDTTAKKFVLTAADAATGVTLANGTGSAGNLGFTTLSYAAGTGTTGSYNSLNGKVLTFKVGDGTSKTINFGTNAAIGQVSTLDQLNAALSSYNAQATVDSTGKITVTTSNEAGAEDLTLSGSATTSLFTQTSASAVIGGDGNTTRNKLVSDYNNLLTQIDQLSGDSGFNGVNLLAGDQVKVIFNEKNTSSVSIKGVSTDSSTLGLAALGSTDFQDATKINAILDKISSANDTLQSQAATFGTNLSVVQNRQDFSKGLINILDTGAANLTDADLNEEAANSQALTTRQSLGISALALANQAQQGILQLLR